MYSVTLVAVPFYFEKHKGFAMALVISGSSAGQLLFGTVMQYSFETIHVSHYKLVR